MDAIRQMLVGYTIAGWGISVLVLSIILIHPLERFERRLEQRKREELLRILAATRNDRPEVVTPEQLQDAPIALLETMVQARRRLAQPWREDN